jgi:hypothetical protein
VLSRADADIALCTDERRAPKLVIRVAVEAAYLHCAKAFMRSKLWDASTHVDRSMLPTIGQMLNDQTGLQARTNRVRKWPDAMRRTCSPATHAA